MPTLREIQQWKPRGSSANGSVRHNKRAGFTHGISAALSLPVAQRKPALKRHLAKHPAVALSVLSRPTLKRVLLTLGFSLASVMAVMHFPKLPSGGPAALAPTAAGNVPAAARLWYQRAWNMAPTRQQAVNMGGVVATAINPWFAVKWVVTSFTSRTIDAMDRQVGQYEAAANRARINLEFYLSWSMFIAFLAIISHFIPRIAYNVRATVHILTSGTAADAAMLAGRVGTKAAALKNGPSKSKSRSRSRSRERARTLRIGAGMPTNTQLLARIR